MATPEQKKKEELNVLFRLAGLMPEVQAAEPESYGPMPVATPTVAPIVPAPIPTVGPRDFSSKSNMKRLETQDQTIGTKGTSEITEIGKKEGSQQQKSEQQKKEEKTGLIERKGLTPTQALEASKVIFGEAEAEAQKQLKEVKEINFQDLVGSKNLRQARSQLNQLSQGIDPSDPLIASVNQKIKDIQDQIPKDKKALDAVYRGDVEAALNEIKDAEKNELSTGEIVARLVIGLAPALIGAAAAGPLGGYYAGQAGVNALDQMNKDEREKIKQLREAAKERLKLLKDKYKEDLDSLNKRAERADEMGIKFDYELAKQAIDNKYKAGIEQAKTYVEEAKMQQEESKDRRKSISEAQKNVLDIKKAASTGAMSKVLDQTTYTFGSTQADTVGQTIKEAIDLTQKNILKMFDETKQLQGQKAVEEQKEVTGVKAAGKEVQQALAKLPDFEKKVVNEFASFIAPRTDTLAEMESVKRLIKDPNISKDQKLTQAKALLKRMNDDRGSDAVQRDEAARLSPFINFQFLNLTQPGPMFGTALEEFAQQLEYSQLRIKNASASSASVVKEIYEKAGIPTTSLPAYLFESRKNSPIIQFKNLPVKDQHKLLNKLNPQEKQELLTTQDAQKQNEILKRAMER